MKIKSSIITLAFLLLGNLSFSQQKTALHHNGNTTIFSGATQFNDAYTNAVTGDTIYLPGGIFNSYPILDKSIVIYGIGVHPDSSLVTGETILSGSIYINGNADSLELHGLHINGHITINYNQKADYVLINRCLMTDFNINGSNTNPCSDLLIKESIILGNLIFSNATASTVSNSLIGLRVYNGSGNAYLNNIFFYDYSVAYANQTISSTDNCLFANNVFLRSNEGIYTNTDFATFSNNVFADTILPGSNAFTGNYMNTSLSTFFVNQSGYTPDFYHDYSLTAPTTYLGLDGTEVGIFGGLYPLKLGNIPENPHISSKTIAPQTSANGDLNIQIQINAQDD